MKNDIAITDNTNEEKRILAAKIREELKKFGNTRQRLAFSETQGLENLASAMPCSVEM